MNLFSNLPPLFIVSKEIPHPRKMLQSIFVAIATGKRYKVIKRAYGKVPVNPVSLRRLQEIVLRDFKMRLKDCCGWLVQANQRYLIELTELDERVKVIGEKLDKSREEIKQTVEHLGVLAGLKSWELLDVKNS